MFDKCPYFDHITIGDDMLCFGLYDILAFIEVFWFENKDAVYDPSALGYLIGAISETGAF